MSSELPPIRPRQAIGTVDSGGLVRFTPQFVRWLELLQRQSESTTVITTAADSFAPVGVAVSAASDLSPVSVGLSAPDPLDPVSGTPTQAEDLAPV